MLLKAFIWMTIGAFWVYPLIYLRFFSGNKLKPVSGIQNEKLLGAAILPLLVFQLSFHLVKPGYILLYLPGIIILGAKWLADPSGRIKIICWRKQVWYLVSVLVISCMYFLYYPADETPPGNIEISPNMFPDFVYRLNTSARSRIEVNDYFTGLWTEAIIKRYDPDSTAVFTAGRDYDWRRTTYQLENFRVIQLDKSQQSPLQMGYRRDVTVFTEGFSLPAEIKYLVFLTEDQAFAADYVTHPGKLSIERTDSGVTWLEYVSD